MIWTTLILVLCAATGLIAAGLRVQYGNKSSVGAVLVILGCIVAFHLIPLLGFPWPLLSEMQGGRYVRLLSIREAWVFDVVEWGFTTVVFALVAKRIRAAWLLPFACVAVAAVVIGVQLAVRMSGRAFYWDLWH